MLRIVKNKTNFPELRGHRYILYAKFAKTYGYGKIGLRQLIGYFTLKHKYGKSL